MASLPNTPKGVGHRSSLTGLSDHYLGSGEGLEEEALETQTNSGGAVGRV